MEVKQELRLTTLKLAKSDSRTEELNDEEVDLKASLAVKRQMVEEMQKKLEDLEIEN